MALDDERGDELENAALNARYAHDVVSGETGETDTPATTAHLAAAGAWTFDERVTASFDDMLRRSIPQYDVMRAAVTDLGSRYVADRTTVVDLGSSRGDSIDPFIRRFGARCRYALIESSIEMMRALDQRYSDWQPHVVLHLADLRHHRVSRLTGNASLVLSIFTLQFIPIEYRTTILRDCWSVLNSGGALILAEKIIGPDAALHHDFVTLYHEMKRQHGYSAAEIDRKALALEGVLSPLTADFNVQMLRAAGFTSVDCFWRWMNFAAWIAVKS